MSIKRKRLNDIKTHAGIVDKTFIPHKAFMRISCLEMEKAHRVRERETARQRIEAIDARLKEIEQEKELLLKRINTTEKNQVFAKVDAKPDAILNKNMPDKNKGLVLKY